MSDRVYYIGIAWRLLWLLALAVILVDGFA
jgi:hypothetical protein